jgi:beta-glucosidase-like glycosyl hydrolase
MERIVAGIIVLCWILQGAIAQNKRVDFTNWENESAWVDSVYSSLSDNERIAQLFWIAAEVLQNEKRFQSTLKLVDTYHPGGVLYMKNPASAVVRFSNSAQAKSKIPMFIAIDGENGLGMRMDGVLSFPKAMTMGATADTLLMYQMGLAIARQFKIAGIHVNMAPVADVNVNPANPIIGVRSYGEGVDAVSRMSVAYMKGMQDGGIMTVAKHFPGHGDTNSDSHQTLPRINHSRERLDSVELKPFKTLIDSGVMGVMTAHLEVSALDSTAALPASVSKKIVTDLLQKELGFSGLVITDAMNMKGVKKSGLPGRVDVLALMGGNDIVESTENIGLAIAEVKKAINAGELTWNDIELKCKKQLYVKRLLSIDKWQSLRTDSIEVRLNDAVKPHEMQQLFDRSLTLVRKAATNENSLTNDSVAFLMMPGQLQVRDTLLRHLTVASFPLKIGSPVIGVAELEKKLNQYGRVVMMMDNSAGFNALWNDPFVNQLIVKMRTKSNFWLIYGGTPYQLKRLKGADKIPNIVLTYEKGAFVYSSVARFLAGKTEITGVLPVSIMPLGKAGVRIQKE